MTKQLIIRKLTHFVAFQGPDVDPEFLDEIRDIYSKYYANGSSEQIYEIFLKIKDVKTNEKFSFAGINKWKYICAILIEIYGSVYRHGYYASEINQLLYYMTRSVKTDRIMKLYESVVITDENREYVRLIESIINLSDEEFVNL